MKDIKIKKTDTFEGKKFQKKNKFFSLLTCGKDEFKDWFDPL